MYTMICVEWVVNHFDLVLTKIDPLLTKIYAKNDFFVHFRS